MSRKAKMKAQAPALLINGDVLRRIRQHARSQSKTEVCGVLIGQEYNGRLEINASIPGVNAAQAGTHVTFTQDTWEHIYKVKDRDYPEERIIGWYHSHPGFGVFLSDHDTFIHKNFFSSPQQVAWVYDPHSDEEGCFGWVGSRLERLPEIAVSDHKGGEEAGETGKPEPVGYSSPDEDEEKIEFAEERPSRRPAQRPEPRWLVWMFNILSHLSICVLGVFIAWTFFPKYLILDPRTGQVFDQTGHVVGIVQERDRPSSIEDGKAPASPPAAQDQNAAGKPSAPATDGKKGK